jgi:SAM-dependent methyltransferase
VANAKLFKVNDDRSALESGGQGTMTSPHIPTRLVAAIGDLQRVLRPFLDGTKSDKELPSGAVGKIADGLVKALAAQAARKPEDIDEFGIAVRREAYRFLMRSKLIQLVQGQGLSSHPVMESIRRTHLLSNNPVGRQVEQWFYNQPFAMALLEAIEFVGEYLERTYDNSKSPWRFCSLGHGSIDEIFDRIGQLGAPSNIRVTYVNEHIEALSASGLAAEQLNMKDQVSLIRLNVLGRGMVRSRLRLVPQDLIVYQVLMHEVSDDTLLDLLDEVHGLLAPGGVFLVGQIHIAVESELCLTHLLGCPIYGRTEEEFADLARRSAFGGHFQWVTPGIGRLCSFLELRRPL